ncbi:uncharacterized protein LOC133806059 [Humulus lupulus]|uniref:uncharacterized protein LOC133806059 n=1 Tax=Humulus lupulus TaxID=3486 RepID=UPI002B40C25F|nr:uncharacterized protein LOC133806059 [Humulus lupulus]
MAYDFEPVYECFRKQSLPNFEGKAHPMVVEDWLKSVEAIIDHMELNDHQIVSCAAHVLKVDARIWWDVVKQTRDLHTMTWADFVQAFSKKYYNAAVLATRVDEFVTLVQGRLSLTAYAHKFDRLARFAPKIVLKLVKYMVEMFMHEEIVPTEAMQFQRFVKGLKPTIVRDVKMNNAEVVSYAEILE